MSNLLGFIAAATVLASFCMTTMVSLRSVAIASNLLFILYGMHGHIYPVLFLHLTLLPINLVKLHRIQHRPSKMIDRGKTLDSPPDHFQRLTTPLPGHTKW
jgi:hypothetical protein